MIPYRQGDIVLVWFPDSNLVTVKKRPAIILQADDLQTGLDQLIIGMVTSNLSRRGHKSRIFVDIHTKSGQITGLLSDSVIMTDNIATVRSSEIHKKIGIFTDLNVLKEALKRTLDFAIIFIINVMRLAMNLKFVPDDTTPEAGKIYFSILQKIGPSKRAEMALELSDGLRMTLEAGVRQRHPEYDDNMVKLAAIRLSIGEELFSRAYPGVDIKP